MKDVPRQTPRRGRPPRSIDAIEASRNRIVKAARDLFAAEGYDGVSMRKVAARAGCLPSTLYTLFPNKRRLLHFLWESIFAELIEVLERAYAKGAPPDRLANLCLAHIDFWLQRPQDYRAIFLVEDRLQDSDDPYFVQNDHAARYLDILRGAIVDGQSRGEIRVGDPDAIRNALLCCLQGVAYNLIAIPEYDWGDPAQLKAVTVKAFIAGLR